jgi:hypothetical protein
MESNCESISSSRLIRVPVIKSRIRSKKEVKLFNNSSRNERDKSKLLAWKKKPLDNWYKVVFQFEKKNSEMVIYNIRAPVVRSRKNRYK